MSGQPLPTAPPQDAVRHLGAGLTVRQREAVFDDAARLCIIAGAGSGKTRVLTRRVARRIIEDPATAAETVVVTFTRKAAGELIRRLADLGVSEEIRTGTFHALAYKALNDWWLLRGETPWRVLEHKAALLGDLLGSDRRRADRRFVRAVAGDLDRVRARMLDPSDVAASRWTDGAALNPSQLADLYRRYEQEKRRRRVVDFEDLLLRWAEVLEGDRGFSEALLRRVRHVYVDEFQDVNPAQYRLLQALTCHPDATLCVVGDDDQAIYGFGGADVTYLREFHRIWPQTATIDLEDNFRCPPQVLSVANRVLAAGTGRRGKVLRPNTAPGPVPEIVAHTDELAEASWVARTLPRVRRPGGSWRRCAVLVRTNNQLGPIRTALEARGIPTVTRGGASFVSSAVVKDVLERLRFAQRQGTRPPGQPFATLVAELAGLADITDVLDFDIGAVVADSPTGNPVDSDRVALVAAAIDYELAVLDMPSTRGPYLPGAGAIPAATAEGFAAWLRATVGAEADDGGADAVALLTMHRAKGLEFDTVFVCGLEEGLMPIGYAGDPGSIEEERRLLYVALTRCRHKLLLSWCRTRSFGGEPKERRPSRFLAVAAETIETLAASEAPAAGWQGWLDAARSELATPRGADDEVLPALLDWRQLTARAEGVPAHLVLTESTLRAIAHRRPGDHSELARIGELDPIKRRRYGDALLKVVGSANSVAEPLL